MLVLVSLRFKLKGCSQAAQRRRRFHPNNILMDKIHGARTRGDTAAAAKRIGYNQLKLLHAVHLNSYVACQFFFSMHDSVAPNR